MYMNNIISLVFFFVQLANQLLGAPFKERKYITHKKRMKKRGRKRLEKRRKNIEDDQSRNSG